jgi:hypothetical protein
MPAATARLPANPTAFRHFRLPPPIAIDFLDAARGRPSSARLGNPPYWGFFLMDNKVTNLMRYYLISYPSSSASFNHPAEIAVNSFLFELIWGFSFIHRVYSAWTHQDFAASARHPWSSISPYQMTWGCARYVQSHPKSVGMAYFPEHILNIATFGEKVPHAPYTSKGIFFLFFLY